MRLLNRLLSLFGIFPRVCHAEIVGDVLNLYTRRGKLIGSVDRNTVSDIWTVNIDVEPYPAFSLWKIIFATRKATWDLETISIRAEHIEALEPINAFLQSLGGKELPGLYPTGDRDTTIDKWHEVYLLWERKPLDNHVIRTRIDRFEILKGHAYVNFAFCIVLATLAILTAHWNTAFPASGVLIFLAAFPMFYILLYLSDAKHHSNDLKRIGIKPRWFGKTVNPKVKSSKKSEAKK